jgi:nitroimidazol reductase NimA-like FMN-containing flavoprotein (pyridoxamine 5'-phosphate oxidase superfamily)
VPEPSSRSAISRTLTLEECWSLLGVSGIGRVALVVDGLPRIIPVNYAVAADVVYFRTAPGTVLTNVTGQKVAFEADAIDPATRSGWSVCLVGTGSASGTDAPPVDTWAPGARQVRYRIVPDEVTGRRLYGPNYGSLAGPGA